MSQSQPTRLWFLHLAARTVDRITAALPLVYLAWALPLLLMVAVTTPPWQNPDEASHMLRISQIAHGGLLGYRFGNPMGSFADPSILQSLQAVYDAGLNPEQRMSLAMLTRAGAVQWGTATPMAIGLTAQYPPVLYAPAVLAVEAGRILHLSVVHSLIAARMANSVVCALIAAFALFLARRTKLALAVLIMLPMTVAMFASAVQDGPIIALTLAVVAGVDRIIAEERDPTFREAMLIGVATVVIITARPPYLPLAALPLVCARRLHRRAWVNSAAIFAVSVLWTGYIAAQTMAVPLRPGVDSIAQLMYILHTPWVIPTIAYNTVVLWHTDYTTMFIGVLGWLNVVLPGWYYSVAWFVLLLAFASAATGPGRRGWVALLIGLAAAGALFSAEYLIWTLPRADHVDGIQGRSFIPLAAVLAIAVPTWRRVGEIVRRPALIAVLGLAVITPVVVVHALILRYYLVP